MLLWYWTLWLSYGIFPFTRSTKPFVYRTSNPTTESAELASSDGVVKGTFAAVAHWKTVTGS